MEPSPPPSRCPVKLLHAVAVRVLSTLATRDTSLTKPSSQLKLWGVGLFEDSPLGLDQVLANDKVTYAPMRDCIMQFLVTILAYGEQFCKALFDGDDSIRALEEEMVVIFELEELLNMVVEGRQDAADGPINSSEVASVVQRLFALSPSIRRARQLQSLQMQETADACVEENQNLTGYTTNFTSTETPVGMLYRRLEAVAEIIRKYDKAAASKDIDAEVYLPAFEKQRKKLVDFYEVRCRGSSLQYIEKSVVRLQEKEARLTNALTKFISHNTESPEPVKIIAITNFVGNTATKFLHQDQVQQLQLRHGGNGTTTAFRATTNPKALGVAKHGNHSICEETQ